MIDVRRGDSMFGEKMKEARLLKGYRQNELASQISVSNTTVNNWERNISKPDLETLTRICKVLDVSPNYFFDFKDETYTLHEKQLITHYRSLDAYGKKAVETTLNLEYQRVHARVENRHFQSFDDAYAFMISGQMYAMGGMNIESMNQEELIDLANDIYEMEQKASKYLK